MGMGPELLSCFLRPGSDWTRQTRRRMAAGSLRKLKSMLSSRGRLENMPAKTPQSAFACLDVFLPRFPTAHRLV